ncbi:MAG: GntR family transcriptional regulator [Rhizobiales bacterium]|nr:GntR family transcriptional regulator [Hyphomicrobiales bacterium]
MANCWRASSRSGNAAKRDNDRQEPDRTEPPRRGRISRTHRHEDARRRRTRRAGLGVGRTTIREALNRWEGLGIIRRRRGARSRARWCARRR